MTAATREEEMFWSFDDRFIGKTHRKDSSLRKRIIARPDSISQADWYSLAGVICRELNKLPAEGG